MPEPTEYRIVESLQAALRGIRTSSGYYHTVLGDAVKLDPESDPEALIRPGGLRPFALLEVLPESREYQPDGRVRIVQPARVHFVADSNPEDDADRVRTFFRACADVEKAVAVDPGRGGLAAFTFVRRRLIDGDEGSEVWAMVDLDVILEREYGTP